MGLVSRLFGRRLPIKYAITAKNNPYKARIHWPPDFRRLSFKEQFRFEKKYRRRSKMKHMNEKWVKSVKIFQWVTCSSLFVWLILFYDWPGEDDDSGEPAFWTLRSFIFGEYAAIWTTAPEGWKPTPVYQQPRKESTEPKAPDT